MQLPTKFYAPISIHNGAFYTPETPLFTDLDKLAQEILEGQPGLDDIAYVVEVECGTGKTRNITPQVAQKVAELSFEKESEPHLDLACWLHRNDLPRAGHDYFCDPERALLERADEYERQKRLARTPPV